MPRLQLVRDLDAQDHTDRRHEGDEERPDEPGQPRLAFSCMSPTAVASRTTNPATAQTERLT